MFKLPFPLLEIQLFSHYFLISQLNVGLPKNILLPKVFLINKNKTETSFSKIFIDTPGMEVQIFKLLLLLHCLEYIHYYNQSVLECSLNMSTCYNQLCLFSNLSLQWHF